MWARRVAERWVCPENLFSLSVMITQTSRHNVSGKATLAPLVGRTAQGEAESRKPWNKLEPQMPSETRF